MKETIVPINAKEKGQPRLLLTSVDIQDFTSPVVFDSYEKLHDAPIKRSAVIERPLRGYQKAAGIILLSGLLYQIIVYYNCKTHKEHPKVIKHMLGS